MKELIEKVKKMREAQKRFYRSRDRQSLVEAKQAEQEVDNLIIQIERNPTLF